MSPVLYLMDAKNVDLAPLADSDEEEAFLALDKEAGGLDDNLHRACS